MPFRFKKTESPAKAVRRVGRERVGAALDCLRQPGHPAAVHGARKEIKKLRALFRLVRGEISAGAYRKGVKALRAAADSLAASRDARVMLKAFAKLVGSRAPEFCGIAGALKKNAQRESRRFRRGDTVEVAERLLHKTSRRVGRLKIKPAGWQAIEPGLKASYRGGRELCGLAHRRPRPENFHEWRKQVKDLWHYCCLLQPVCPAVTRDLTEALERLGAQLGEDHDLFLLQEFSGGHCANHAREAAALNRLIVARQTKLRAAALKLGARFYADPPARFCGRLGDWRR